MNSIRRKKAQSQYISWVLVFGMVIALSFILYNWTIERAKRAAEDIEEIADPLVCSEMGINVDGICQNFRQLEINVTNVNKMQLKGLLVRTVGLYPETTDYLGSRVIFIDISAGDSEKIRALKKGTLSQVKVIPIAERNGKNIYCEDRAITKEKNDLLQC